MFPNAAFIPATPLLLRHARPLRPSLTQHPLVPHLPHRATHARPPRFPTLSAATPSPARARARARAPPSASVPLNLGPLRLSVPGRLLLCAVPALWASFIACAKLLYVLPRALPPAWFNASRLIVSSLFFLPTLLTEIRLHRRRTPPASTERRTIPSFLVAGFELGTLMFLANLFQIAGLRHTDASRAAFLNQLSTVMVPLAAALFGIEALSTRVTVGAVCALAGVALLTMTAAPASAAAAAVSLPFLGDALEICAALLFSAYVLRVSHHARAAGRRSGPLVAVKVVTQAVLSIVWLGVRSILSRTDTAAKMAATAAATVAWTPLTVLLNVFLVLWAGVLVSATTSWMQTKGQAAVSASEAAILYAAQPLWACLIATLMLGETLGPTGMAGAGMIVAGTVVSSTGKGK